MSSRSRSKISRRSIPLSVSSSVSYRPLTMRSLSDNIVEVSGTEYLDFLNQSGFDLSLSPTMIGGRLATFSQNYERYKFTKMTFHFVTSCPTSTAGSLVFFYDVDVNDDDSLVTIKEAMANVNSCMCSVYGSMDYPIKFDKTVVPLFRDATSADQRLSYQGQFRVMVVGAPPDLTLGQMFVSYVCELHNPCLVESIELQSVVPSSKDHIDLSEVYVLDYVPWSTFGGFPIVLVNGHKYVKMPAGGSLSAITTFMLRTAIYSSNGVGNIQFYNYYSSDTIQWNMDVPADAIPHTGEHDWSSTQSWYTKMFSYVTTGMSNESVVLPVAFSNRTGKDLYICPTVAVDTNHLIYEVYNLMWYALKGALSSSLVAYFKDGELDVKGAKRRSSLDLPSAAATAEVPPLRR